MEKTVMAWNKEIENKWNEFIDAVLSRDKNQFKLFCEYTSLVSNKQNTQEQEEELVF